ncbi:LLM class flavin-dependent oxidoreductase [Cellulomonas oligotrophica]|uniref:Alkanesulfonate monooxygenase SsuD/methylene tetrahydromethanopterin reductase-like flavin-dependent oxidoreductase (Luciferase family) n=1 Tax=Cellulomonas oligotrophica TaxID=931536 RepID=A0A7Y9FHE2_9CELL|nr:LLM class flavin-dependent oxidoreductase [Cellulomonas oligotrophica]NYD85996.1 alkanesulfonate monooxygenase SsuD/methylene tetrahydromethanopterin reductase-like flavin-dependent oxidoreductase (luciferase family) [Cellulomonas oligotrophica]GIG30996.1 hypothetical protein Col01nite_01550 [Cellulomonas oligotrophica]
MKLGIGLSPHDPEGVFEWARRAEAGPYSTIGVLDRVVYLNPDALLTLAALAGATSRVRLQTEVLLAPLRNTTLLAKEVATLDRLSGGRFVLGLGVGNYRGPYHDDYHAVSQDLHTRGRRLDEQVAEMRRLWAGEQIDEQTGPIGPLPSTPGGPRSCSAGSARAPWSGWRAGARGSWPPVRPTTWATWSPR